MSFPDNLTIKGITYSISDSKADYHTTNIKTEGFGYRFNLHTPQGQRVVNLPFAGEHNVQNATAATAFALAIGIGLQNFPEGIAVSMPLKRQGVSSGKSFWYGQLSAIVEPIAGVIGAVAVIYMQPLLPYALAFAAGAMIYVVIEEVVPETQRDNYTDIATLGFIGGFLVMMILDVSLG